MYKVRRERKEKAEDRRKEERPDPAAYVKFSQVEKKVTAPS